MRKRKTLKTKVIEMFKKRVKQIIGTYCKKEKKHLMKSPKGQLFFKIYNF